MRQTFQILLLGSIFLAGSNLSLSSRFVYGKPAKQLPSSENTIEKGQQLYQQKCSLCHQPKAISLKTQKEWLTLIYTSGCPDVTIKLKNEERNQLKDFINQAIKKSKN